jgi:hypothetical protein
VRRGSEVLDWIPFALLGLGSLAFVFYAAMLWKELSVLSWVASVTRGQNA